MTHSLSPLDGRYAQKVDALRPYFSEEALMRARVTVEILSFLALSEETKVRELPQVKGTQKKALLTLIESFGDADIAAIKKIEKVTNHDMKAVEYFLKEKVEKIPGLRKYVEFIHFGLTSEDVNNLAYGILIGKALEEVIRPGIATLLDELKTLGKDWMEIPMLSLTHGQPATPTSVGKEIMVFVERLERQQGQLKAFSMCGKFGGAVGNYSAHRAAYPEIAWEAFGKKFIRSLGLTPLTFTTQINPHDDLAELSHLLCRINTILINLCRDHWSYISRGVFKQKVIKGEVGSSTMPHKVNPIDFENAEGNLGLSNALFAHFAEKLPISRLQRDLSDSTVQRNIGVAFGYHVLALASLTKGLGKITLDHTVLQSELDKHPEVLTEAIQTVLRKNGIEGGYEKMKELSRGERVTKEQLREFVKSLKLPKKDTEHLLKICK